MMYLSKGMEVPDGAEGVFRVCRWDPKPRSFGRGAQLLLQELLMGKRAQSRGWRNGVCWPQRRNVEVWPTSAC